MSQWINLNNVPGLKGWAGAAGLAGAAVAAAVAAAGLAGGAVWGGGCGLRATAEVEMPLKWDAIWALNISCDEHLF